MSESDAVSKKISDPYRWRAGPLDPNCPELQNGARIEIMLEGPGKPCPPNYWLLYYHPGIYTRLSLGARGFVDPESVLAWRLFDEPGKEFYNKENGDGV